MRGPAAMLTVMLITIIDTSGGTIADTPRAGNGEARCRVTSDFADGCAKAPDGTPQYPALFSAPVLPHNVAYPTRPPWNVPGVDYYVGASPAVSLREFQAEGALPNCAQLNRESGLIRIVRTPCELSGIDFSAHGGACVYIGSAAGSEKVKITNSLFSVGTAPACKGAYLVSTGKGFAGSLEIEQNTFLGNGPSDQSMSGAIGSAGSGPVRIRYNYITKMDQHGVDFASPPSSLVERYNVITDFGMQIGSHPNFTYYCGGTFTGINVEFNLSAEWYRGGAQSGAQVLTIHADSGCQSNFVNPMLAHNVVLAPGSSVGRAQTASYVIAPTEDNGVSLSGAAIVGNFVDWSGAYGPIYPSKGSGFRCSSNVDIYRAAPIVGRFGNVVCK